MQAAPLLDAENPGYGKREARREETPSRREGLDAPHEVARLADLPPRLRLLVVAMEPTMTAKDSVVCRPLARCYVQRSSFFNGKEGHVGK